MTDAIYFFIAEIGDRFIFQPCPDPTDFQRRRKFSAVSKSLSIASGHTEAFGIERTFAGAAGSPPGIRRRKAGTDQGTAVSNRSRGNSRRLPLRTAVEGVPREARKRRTACHRPLTFGAQLDIQHLNLPMQVAALDLEVISGPGDVPRVLSQL